MNPKTRQKRLDMGVCIGCGAVLDTDGKMCSKCRKKATEESMRAYRYYQDAGICPICKKERLYGDEKACPECRAKRACKSAKALEKNRSRLNELTRISHRRTYATRKNSGICVRCGKRNAISGRSMCGICLEKKKEYNQAAHEKKSGGSEISRIERPSYGKCYICGADVASGRLCEACKQRAINNLPAGRGGNDVWRQDNKLIGGMR